MGVLAAGRVLVVGVAVSLGAAALVPAGAAGVAVDGALVDRAGGLAWEEPDAAGVAGLVSADAESAVAAAEESGEPVEDVSQRTETMSVQAQPDGTWSAKIYAEPVRVERGDGSWAPIDTTLVSSAKGVGPRAAAAEVSFSNGGSSVLARLGGDDSAGKPASFALNWPGDLPAPRLSGSSATYKDAADGADVVIVAQRSGFSHSVVLSEEPAEPPVYRYPMTLSKGLTATVAPTGAIQVTDAAGEIVVYAPRPRMWDAQVEPLGGVPANVRALETRIETGSDGTPVLVITPDPEFLSDPATVYPVTVDPTFNWGVGVASGGQTWVQYNDYLESQAGSAELKVGTYNGSETARTFLRFGVTPLAGTQILAAQLKVQNYYSSSCSGATIYAQRINENWSGTTLTWSNQPTAVSTGQAGFTPSYGYTSSCPANYATWDVTAMTAAWVSGAAPNYGMRLRAADENSIHTWRRYRSSYWSSIDAAQEPHLLVEYNRKPNLATNVSPASGTITTDTTPQLQAKATDPDGDRVALAFEIWNSAHTSRRANVTSGLVASGTVVPWNVPVALAAGTYHWRVAVKDEHGFWNGGWSAWASVSVDNVGPTVSAVKTNGSTACGQVFSDTTPTLSAVVTENMGTPVEADFEIYTLAGAVVANTDLSLAGLPSGSTFTYTAPTALADGGYKWRVRGWDTRQWGAYSADCTFTVDNTGLVEAPVVTAAGTYTLNTAGSFSVTSTEPGVASFVWGLNTDAPTTVVATTPGEIKQVAFTPTKFGPSWITVRSRDQVGNLGPKVRVDFRVRSADGVEDPSHVWGLDETSGTTAADTGVATAKIPLTLAGGSSWSVGRWATEECDPFGDCVIYDPTDGAAAFDGTTGVALSTGGGPIDITQNFTVAAWVRLSDATITRSAVSQDGVRTSGVQLGYRAAENRWSFGLAASDTDTPVVTAALSTEPPEAGLWTHLVGVYDAADTAIHLYVNGSLVSSVDFTSTWSAGGRLRVGAGFHQGAASAFWNGDVDDVRIFDGALPPDVITQMAAERRGDTPPANAPPTAAIAIPVCTQLSCTFNATASADPDGTIESYTWDFGDGTTGTGATPSHTYPTANSYTVTLTVTDNEGATHDAGRDVSVAAAPANPFFEVDGLNWGFAGTGTTARSTEQALEGVASLKYTISNAYSFTIFNTDIIPVTGGHTYTGDIAISPTGPNVRGQLFIEWRNDQGLVLSEAASLKTAAPANGWIGLEASGVAPGGAIQARLKLEVTVAPPEVVSTTGAGGSAATTIVVPRPAPKPGDSGVGDTLYAFQTIHGETLTHTNPTGTGWTIVRTDLQTHGSGNLTRIWRKTVLASEPTSYTFGIAGSTSARTTVLITRVKGVNGSINPPSALNTATSVTTQTDTFSLTPASPGMVDLRYVVGDVLGSSFPNFSSQNPGYTKLLQEDAKTTGDPWLGASLFTRTLDLAAVATGKFAILHGAVNMEGRMGYSLLLQSNAVLPSVYIDAATISETPDLAPPAPAPAFDVAAGVGFAAGNLSWTHTPVAAQPDAVLVQISQNASAADNVSSVTYGGVPMTRVAYLAGEDVGVEDGACYAYLLTQGIPSGPQTVFVTGHPGSTKDADSITLTSTGTVYVEDVRTLDSASVDDPAVTFSTTTETLPFGVLHSAHDTTGAISNGPGYTTLSFADYGNNVARSERAIAPFPAGSPVLSFATVGAAEGHLLGIALGAR